MIKIREFLLEDGSSPFGEWFESLNGQTAAKVNTYLVRIENGNTSSLKSLGDGVHESRINWGPGYQSTLGKKGNS